jgi:hypothetical protein
MANREISQSNLLLALAANMAPAAVPPQLSQQHACQSWPLPPPCGPHELATTSRLSQTQGSPPSHAPLIVYQTRSPPGIAFDHGPTRKLATWGSHDAHSCRSTTWPGNRGRKSCGPACHILDREHAPASSTLLRRPSQARCCALLLLLLLVI